MEWGLVIHKLSLSGELEGGVDVHDLDDFVWKTAFGDEHVSIGAEKLAPAIVAGGWTWVFCSLIGFECPYY